MRVLMVDGVAVRVGGHGYLAVGGSEWTGSGEYHGFLVRRSGVKGQAKAEIVMYIGYLSFLHSTH